MGEAFDNSVRPTFITSVTYSDPKRMYRWLEDAFGFEPYGIILDGEGNVVHAEMSYGNGLVMVGYPWPDLADTPAQAGGINTQRLHVRVEGDIETHCERARAAGAEITQEPETQFYGDRTYRVRDPEGHNWSFAQTVKAVNPSEWEAMGMKTSKTLAA